ncbi:hypothetical protein NL676_031351 [Syzygium grande]|nr:hypothetical protein NL676_031351 [Syzygium grande]
MIILGDEILLREIALAALLFLVTHFFFRSLLLRLNPREVSPGPKGWPVVGALPLMGNMPYVTLWKMAKKYGPMMYLKMGSRDMVLVSTPDAARAFLKTLDLNVSNRPLDLGAVQMTYNGQDMVFTDYGPRWKLLRKLSNFHMLGWKALEDWANARSAQLQYMVPLHVRVQQPMGYPFRLIDVGHFNIGDFIPSVAWMDLQGIEGRMKRLHQKFDTLLTKMIEQHSVPAHKRKGKPDFLDVPLANRENSEGEKLSLINIKAPLGIYMSKPRYHVERNRVVAGRRRDGPSHRCRHEDSDLPKLPYLRAICKEIFRKHPSMPLNVPRVSTKACRVGSYYIPKNTRLAVNIVKNNFHSVSTKERNEDVADPTRKARDEVNKKTSSFTCSTLPLQNRYSVLCI